MHNVNVNYCSHPLLTHHMSILRDKHVKPELFRNSLKRVSQFVLYDATKDLPLSTAKIETPLAITEQQKLTDDPIIIAPILRAGLSMAEVMLDLLPMGSVYHLGLYRDEKTLQPITYYNKLSEQLDYSLARIFILDPMLATGGSITKAVDIFKQLGARESHITVACLIAANEGITTVLSHSPEISLHVGVLDAALTKHGFISPGLGDAGDRFFNT